MRPGQIIKGEQKNKDRKYQLEQDTGGKNLQNKTGNHKLQTLITAECEHKKNQQKTNKNSKP